MLYNNWWYYMQVKIYPTNVPAPLPPVDSPYNTQPDPNTGTGTPVNMGTGTKLLSATTPRFLVNLHPAHVTVLQNVVKSPDTGDFYITQVHTGTNGTSTPYESTQLSRCDASGNLLDSMLLNNAGHGTNFGLEYINGIMYIIITWNQPASLGQTPTYDIVRFPYIKGGSGAYDRTQIPGLTVQPKFESGYVVQSYDWASDSMIVRKASGGTAQYIWRKISELRDGTNHIYKTITLQETPPTLQGFCSINNTLFRYIGAANGESLTPKDPMMIQQFNLLTGARVDQVAYPNLGKNSAGQFLGGLREPEGMSIYRDPNTRLASLIFGLTLDQPGKHTWPVYIIDNIGDVAS